MRYKTTAAIIQGILLFTMLHAQATLPAGVSVHRLNNGLEVLLIENPALPMTGVNVVVKTGSAYETFATNGTSHMLEHLLFNGTTSRTQKKLYDDTDRIGGYNNANTGDYYTNFMMVTPADKIVKGMEIQADMLFNSVLPPEKFEKEKGIVLEEIAQSLNRPSSQIEHNLQSILYQGHALSLPTLGTYTTINNLSRKDVLAYYRSHYRPNNMVLSVIGNFNSDTLLKVIDDLYGKYAPGSITYPADAELAVGFAPPVRHVGPAGGFHHRFYSGKNPVLHIAFPLPLNISTELADLLDLSLTEKTPELEKALKQKFAGQVRSLSAELRLAPVANYMVLKVILETDKQIEPITAYLTKTIKQLDFSLSKDRVESQIARSKTDFYKQLEKPHMFGIYHASTLATAGIDGFLSSLDKTRYRAAAKELKHFKPDGVPTVIVHHVDKRKTTQDTHQTAVKLFRDRKSGLDLIVKQNSISPLLAVHFLMKHKAGLEAKWGGNAAKILHDCFGQRMKSEKNQRISRRYGLTFTVNDNPYIPMDDIYLHPDFGYIRVEGLADDLAGAITYLNNQIFDFTPTKEEYKEAYKTISHGEYLSTKDNSRDMFNKTYEELIFEPDKYPTDSVALTYDNLLRFTREYFRPQNMIVSIVSPVSPDSVYKLFKKTLPGTHSITAGDSAAYEQSFTRLTEPVYIEKEGGGEQSYLFWGFIESVDEKDKPALKALSLVLSDKIIFDIRERQGLAYRMLAGIDLRKDLALFFIRLGTRPQNIDGLLPQIPSFFRPEMLADISESDLEKSINMYLGRMMFRRLSSINQAFYLGYSWYLHGDLEYDSRFLDELKQVSLEDVNRVAKKYLTAPNPATVIVR
ncbi:MAG: insulinase family protein [FCB group bacterium]|nr:insulinase family protein [FCB group bacterium]